jgi:hypothetical protein
MVPLAGAEAPDNPVPEDPDGKGRSGESSEEHLEEDAARRRIEVGV